MKKNIMPNQKLNFSSDRIVKGFLLLPLWSALFFDIHLIPTYHSPIEALQYTILGLPFIAFVAYFNLSIPTLIWSFILECLYKKPKIRIIWGFLGTILISCFWFIIEYDNTKSFYYVIPICIFLGGITTLYFLQKNLSGSLKLQIRREK